MTAVAIRVMAADDWPAVRRIYREGIAGGMATFETAAPDWPEWDRGHRADARLVADDGGVVVGWAALLPVSRRPAYVGVAEVSVYVATAHQGRGIGRMLLERLVETSETVGVWTLQAAVFPDNAASIRLHERVGFRVVGRRERIGTLRGVWHDTVLLERRSARVGLE